MNKTNYNDIFEKTAAEHRGDRLLLHCCCAPCTLGVVERVTAFFDVTLYWYNPNIMPRAEHDKRLTELRRVADIFSLKLIEGGYDNDAYCDMTKEMRFEAEGGARCFACIDMRLAAAACFADENDFDFYCSTLTVSPHKNAELINRTGKLHEKGARWLYSDFKKKDGFLRSGVLCAQYEIYRQNYCGCKFS